MNLDSPAASRYARCMDWDNVQAQGVDVDADARALIDDAKQFETVEVIFVLRAASQIEDIAMTPAQMIDAAQRGLAQRRFVQVQKMRYGEALKRLRSLVSMDLRGEDDVPSADHVRVWGTPANVVRAALSANVKRIACNKPGVTIR